MSHVKVVTSRRKIIDFVDVHDGYVKTNYKSFDSIRDLANFCTENSLDVQMAKAAIVFDSALIEMAIVPPDHEDPIEYTFESLEEAEKFVNMQGYDKSIHLAPKDTQTQVNVFFSDSDCDFENCEELRAEYKKELTDAGGEACPDCTKSSVMRKYQDKIMKILERKNNNTKGE
tara:strand:+ start:117 stop:635 length:519 start_codon:yes stop_codon:yes gene_type:complete